MDSTGPSQLCCYPPAMLVLLACTSATVATDSASCVCDDPDHAHDSGAEPVDSAPPTDTAASGVPVAVLSVDVDAGTLPLTVHFDPVGSAAPAGLHEVRFDYGDGSSGTDTEHTYWASGSFEATLEVEDVTGLVATARVSIDVDALPCPEAGKAEVWGTVADLEVTEASGVVESRDREGVLWTHNDAGHGPTLYALSREGTALGRYTVDGAPDGDWEDLAIGRDPDTDEPVLYVGDIGDNNSERDEIRVWVVPEPEVSTDQLFEELTVEAAEVVLDYPAGGALNAEILLVDPLTQDLYVVTKDYAGPTGVFRKAAPHTDGERATMEQVAELHFGEEPFIGGATTGGGVREDGLYTVIRTYGTEAYVFRRDGTAFADAFAGEPCTVVVPDERQGEAIDFTADGTALVSISEGDEQDVNVLPLSF